MSEIIEAIADHLQSEYDIAGTFTADISDTPGRIFYINLNRGILSIELRSHVLLVSLINDYVIGGRTDWTRRFELADPLGLERAIGLIIKTTKKDDRSVIYR